MTASSTRLAPVAQWDLVPPLGDLNAYIAAVGRLPVLTAQEELDLAKRLQREADLQAAGQLILSHLRLVVSVARQYLGYGLPHADLIQEGNIGLMKAVRRFDPDKGVRLVSYALHWIKAEIHEYILKNWRMVKVATTKAQRKLFFKLRSLKNQLSDADAESSPGISPSSALTCAQVQTVCHELQVKPQDVRAMEVRMQGKDLVLEPLDNDEDPHAQNSPLSYLHDPSHEPSAILEVREHEHLTHIALPEALAQLDDRSRTIVQERWLKVDDQGNGGATLHELASRYGISAERVRQIEVAAMKKMRLALASVH
jgi:RNA polymerase sigma-32 factor